MGKKWWICSSVLLACMLLQFINPSAGGVAGSAHDFSSMGWSGGRLCRPCHTPHNALTTVADAPLWNHEVTTATYTLYSSPTLQVAPEQPRGVSKLCLSCHDGTVAIDSFGGNTGTSFMGGSGLIGTNLTDDHPVSIRWQHQNELQNDTCLNCHNVHASPSFISELPFFDRYVECATCHDVHAKTSYPKLLRLPNQGSQICLHCHGK